MSISGLKIYNDNRDILISDTMFSVVANQKQSIESLETVTLDNFGSYFGDVSSCKLFKIKAGGFLGITGNTNFLQHVYLMQDFDGSFCSKATPSDVIILLKTSFKNSGISLSDVFVYSFSSISDYNTQPSNCGLRLYNESGILTYASTINLYKILDFTKNFKYSGFDKVILISTAMSLWRYRRIGLMRTTYITDHFAIQIFSAYASGDSLEYINYDRIVPVIVLKE